MLPLEDINEREAQGIDPGKQPDRTFELYSVPSFDSLLPETVLGSDIKSGKQRVEPGDVLICKINPRINRVWIVGAKGEHDQIGSTEWIIIKPVVGILPEYLLYFCRSNAFRALLNSDISGVGGSLTRARPKFVFKYEVPIAPLAEQRRIVAQLEATMQRLEASQERLENLPALLKKFRQAVLAAAVSGKLTEAWRAKQPQVETGADLLDRIRAERRAEWEAKQRVKLTGKQLSLNDSWKLKYEEPAALNTSALAELPEGWAWCKLESVAEMCLGKMLDGAKNQGTLQPYMGNINVRWGSFDLDGMKMMRFTDAEDERYSVKRGDLVICEGGEPGRAAVWESDSSIKIQKALHRVRPDSKFLMSYFLYYNLNLDAAVHRLDSYFTGTGIQHFTGKALARYTLPVPPIAEQQEIVRQVNHYFDLADQLEARFEQAAALVEQLPQALLAKAFSGQLVPQDPNDEPASVLLERLATEAPAPAKGKRGRAPKAMADAPLFK
jgi:type I restriction enzyme S subunit